MVSRIALIETFKDTLKNVKENPVLSEQTRKMMAGTMLYLRGYKAMNPSVKRMIPDVTVWEDTSFHTAALFSDGSDRVAVLNFANAYTPGGSHSVQDR